MLVISRKIGECVVVGSDVVVRILGVDGRRIRVGIEAPRTIPVRRGELPAFPLPSKNNQVPWTDQTLSGAAVLSS